MWKWASKWAVVGEVIVGGIGKGRGNSFEFKLRLYLCALGRGEEVLLME